MSYLYGNASQIIEIEGQRYIIPTVLKNGRLVQAYDKKLKLPIEVTESFHIHRRTKINKPERTFRQRIVSLITLGIR